MPAIENIVSFLGIVRSRALEKNLLPLLFLTTIILYYILNVNLTPTDNCSYHPSSKKALFTANRNHHRKSQLDKGQRSRAYGKSQPNRCIYITAPASTVQGISWKEGWKDCQSQNTRKSAVKQSFLEMAS